MQDANHVSSTTWLPDNYSEPWVVPELSPLPWNHILGQGHPCYNPEKDLVIPTLLRPQLLRSPLVGNQARERSTLVFFRGDFRDERQAKYSRGIRQRLRQLSRDGGWQQKYGIAIGNGSEVPGEYGELLASSTFCLVLPGEGYSSRAEDSILNGCIPVVIMDNVEPVFSSVLDWKAFGVRVGEAHLEELPELLLSYSETEIRNLQISLSHVWHRFAYTSMPIYQQFLRPVVERNRQDAGNRRAPPSLPGPQYGNLVEDDALATILAWLHSRMERPRGET